MKKLLIHELQMLLHWLLAFNAPIFTYENILDKAGIYLKSKDEFATSQSDSEIEKIIEEPKSIDKKSAYSRDSLKQLNEKLEKAVLDEDYELAAKIRDEINKRTSIITQKYDKKNKFISTILF